MEKIIGKWMVVITHNGEDWQYVSHESSSITAHGNALAQFFLAHKSGVDPSALDLHISPVRQQAAKEGG